MVKTTASPLRAPSHREKLVESTKETNIPPPNNHLLGDYSMNEKVTPENGSPTATKLARETQTEAFIPVENFQKMIEAINVLHEKTAY